MNGNGIGFYSRWLVARNEKRKWDKNMEKQSETEEVIEALKEKERKTERVGTASDIMTVEDS